MSTKSKTVGTSLGLAALALAVATFLFWFRTNNLVGIPENRTAFVLAFVLAAVMGVSAFVMRTRWFGGIAALGAIVIGCFLPFTVAISRQEVAPDGIKVGETIPAFTALNDRGEPFDSQRLGGKTVLMKFFRGHW